jgi:hypothetical protein
MKRFACFASTVAVVGLCGAAFGVETTKGDSGVHAFEMKSITGEPIKLSKFKDHVCMIVNVASR